MSSDSKNGESIQQALSSLKAFRTYAASPYHERFSFPLFRGTYFSYRKIDVMRVISIASAISESPTYIDVGCGCGDFLKKIRRYIPNSIGMEKDPQIFYYCRKSIPEYIKIVDARWGIEKKYDVIFVGWMDPGIDFRDAIAAKTDVIITTFDQGISLAAEFDGHGFQRVATWRTPTWEDVNSEIMNRYYTKHGNQQLSMLSSLRGAHNLWYVYSKKPVTSQAIKAALEHWLVQEKSFNESYDFESVLDECGYRYLEKLPSPFFTNTAALWEIKFNPAC